MASSVAMEEEYGYDVNISFLHQDGNSHFESVFVERLKARRTTPWFQIQTGG